MHMHRKGSLCDPRMPMHRFSIIRISIPFKCYYLPMVSDDDCEDNDVLMIMIDDMKTFFADIVKRKKQIYMHSE